MVEKWLRFLRRPRRMRATEPQRSAPAEFAGPTFLGRYVIVLELHLENVTGNKGAVQ